MNVRKYGHAPFNIVVVHGGPGAAGEMMAVAKRLAHNHGVLEPLQTAFSISGQCDELREVLESTGETASILIGYSWGAMLSYIFAATYPEMIKKLILVSSAVFQETFAHAIMKTRFERCSFEEKKQLQRLLDDIENSENQEHALFQLGKLLSKIDAYNPLPEIENHVDVSYEIYKKVWGEAQQLRKSGKLMELGAHIQCPVVAIHGDYDPHPAEGVRAPLEIALRDFRFILLKNCGHTPWQEREAKEEFYHFLEQEMN